MLIKATLNVLTHLIPITTLFQSELNRQRGKYILSLLEDMENRKVRLWCLGQSLIDVTRHSIQRSVGLSGMVVRALLQLLPSTPLSPKMITLKKTLNYFTSRKDFENWMEFECLIITPFFFFFKGDSGNWVSGDGFSWFASKKTLEEITRWCCDSLVHLFGSSSCGKGHMLF